MAPQVVLIAAVVAVALLLAARTAWRSVDPPYRGAHRGPVPKGRHRAEGEPEETTRLLDVTAIRAARAMVRR